MFAISILTSSLATVALASIYFFERISFLLVVSLRIIIGAAHGIVFPVTYTLWAQWAVPNERGTLAAIGFSGTQLGTGKLIFNGCKSILIVLSSCDCPRRWSSLSLC